MEKASNKKEKSLLKRIEQLEIEASILRGAYFQLEKTILEKEKAQEDFEAIFNNIRDTILYVNRLGIIVNINPRIKDLLGYDVKDVKGKNFARLGLLRRKNLPTIIKLFKGSLSSDKITPLFELEIKHKNGNWIPIEVNTKILKKDNKVLGALNVLRDITKRKKIQQELQKSEADYRNLIESSNDIIQSVRLDGYFSFVNKAWCNAFGYSRTEALNLNLFNLIHPDSIEHCKALFKKVLKGEKLENIEAKFINKSGDTIILRGQAGPRYFNKKVVATLGYFNNITEQKKIEEEKKLLFHILEERVKELTCLYKIDELIKKRDLTIEKIFQKITKIISLAWQYPKIACVRIIYEDKKYKSKNFKNTKWCQSSDIVINNKKTGSVKVCYLEKKPDLEKGPFLKEERSLINSITQKLAVEIERRKAQEEVRKSEKSFRSIFELSPDGIITVDLKRTITSCNKSFLNLSGYSGKEIIGKRITQLPLIIPGETPKYIKIFTSAIKGKVPKNFEFKWKHKNGSIRSGEVSVSLIKIKGKLIGLQAIIRDNTERKQAQELLQKSQTSLIEAQHIARLGNWNWNIITNKLWWSDEIYRIFGLKPQEFEATYEAFLKSVHRDDKELVKQSVNRALYKRKPYSIEHRVVLPNGLEHIVHEQAKAFFDKKGKPIRMMGTVQDITERKKAEQELKESEERFRNIFEGAKDGFIYLNKAGKILNVNKAITEIFGGLKKELLGKHFTKIGIVSLKDIPNMIRDFARTLVGKGSGLEIHITNKKGKEITLESSSSLLKIDNKILGVMVVVRDITERKLMEKELAKHREGLEKEVKERTKELSIEHGKLQSLLESTKLGIIMIDLSFNVMIANKAAKENLGKSPDESITFNDLKEKLKGVKLSRTLSYYVRSTKSLNIQEVLIENRYFRLFLSPVKDIKEKLSVGVVIIMEDISEEKKFEKMKNEIISVTSHQLRTPLSVIKGNLEMILTGDTGETTKEQKELLNEAFSGNERMIELINNLMDLSKIDDKRFKLKLQPTKLEDLVSQSVKELLPFASEHKVALSYKAPSISLPEVNIDRQRIKQVLQNLIDNAIKFSSIDDKGKVMVMIKKSDKFLRVSVKDNGIGIPEDEQGKIFERFFRASTAAKLDPGGGTGLGLYIAKAIIEESGGKMGFTSQPGKGTTFYFTLPLIG